MTKAAYVSTQGAGVDKGFFNGKIYPLLVAAITLVGFYFRIDYLTNVILILLMLFGLFRANTLRPLFPYLFCVFYQMPRGTVRGEALRFPYLLSEWRLYILIPSLAVLTIGTFAYLFHVYKQNRKEARLGVYQKNTLPLLLPTLLFCAAMFLGGLGAMDSYGVWDFLFPLGQMLSYLVIFAIIYRGIEREHTEELLSHIAYVTMITAWVLILEVAWLYSQGIVSLDGSIPRSEFVLGFGQATLIAFHLASLIPMQMYGFATQKKGLVYILSAGATCIAMIACTSRNATILGTLIFILCFYFCFSTNIKGKKKRLYNQCIIVFIFICLLFVFLYHFDKIELLFSDLIIRGLDDHGRFSTWNQAYEKFKENPFFGNGFYHIDLDNEKWLSSSFSPCMAHNTIIELLSATGLFGLACYLIYRIATLCVFFRRKDENKRFLFFVCLPLLLMSLLDNFMFQMFTTFHYITALAIACKIDREQRMHSTRNKNLKI